MGDDVNTLLADFQLLMVGGRKLGLVVNVAKREIITDDIDVLQKFRNIAPGIKHVEPASAIGLLLGAPIGGEQSFDKA